MRHLLTDSDLQKSVYVVIGQRIRERRKLLRMSQAQLAERMGFSYQQIQKYESGTSQASAGKLLLFSKVLNVPPAYFYDGITIDDEIGKGIDNDVISKARDRGFNVLLIDDNIQDAMLFQTVIARLFGQVDLHIINNADMVLDYLQHCESKYCKARPDLIAMDLSLSRASGLQLLKSIKSHPKASDIPVVIITNSVSKTEMMESYRRGSVGFIQKSTVNSEFKDAIETLIHYWSKVVILPCA